MTEKVRAQYIKSIIIIEKSVVKGIHTFMSKDLIKNSLNFNILIKHH